MMHLSTPLLSYVSIILIVPLSFAEVYQETDEDSSDYSERKNGGKYIVHNPLSDTIFI